MIFEELESLVVDVLDEFLDFLVHHLGSLLGIRLREFVAAGSRTVVEAEVAHLVGHAVVLDHGVGHLGQALQVVQRAGGRLSVKDFLRHAASDQRAHLVHHLALRVQLMLLGQIPGCAQGVSARDEGDLEERACVRKQPAHDGVARFVVRYALLLERGDNRALLLDAADYAVHCIQEVLALDLLLAPARGGQGRFVADVGYVRAAEARGVLRHECDVEVRIQLEALEVDLEDLLALLELGQVHMDLTVETAGAHQGLIQNVGAVGGGEHYHSAVGSEAVHLGEELVKGVLAFVVSTETCVLAAGAADCVYFVDEDYAGGLLLRLLEEVADAACTHTHEHLHEVRAAYAEERDVRLTGDCLCKQGLTRAGRADQKSTLRNLGSEGGVLLRVLEEIHYFDHLFFRSIQAGDILEGDVDLVLVRQLALGLAHIEGVHSPALAAGTAHSAVHSTEHPDPEHHQKQQRKGPLEDTVPDLAVVLHYDGDTAGFVQLGVQLAELTLRIEGGGHKETEMGRFRRDFPAETALVLLNPVRLDSDGAFKVVADEVNVLHVALEHHLLHIGPFDLLWVGLAAVPEEEEKDSSHEKDVEPGKVQFDGLYLYLRIFLFVVRTHLALYVL